jgi:hypothetical protein
MVVVRAKWGPGVVGPDPARRRAGGPPATPYRGAARDLDALWGDGGIDEGGTTMGRHLGDGCRRGFDPSTLED